MKRARFKEHGTRRKPAAAARVHRAPDAHPGAPLSTRALDYEGRIADLRAKIRELEESRATTAALLRDLETREGRIEHIHQSWVAIFDAIRDPIFMHDKEGRIVRANRAYAELAGMDIKDVIGLPYWRVFPRLEGPLASCRAVVSGGHESGEEELVLDRGQAYRCRHFAVADPVSGYSASVHLMQDVTEHKRVESALRESEEKFRQISVSARDAILMLDNDGRVSFWNPAATQIFGYTAEEAMGRPLHDLVTPQRYHEAFRKGFEHFRKTGEGAIIGKTLELTARKQDGGEFPVDLSVSAIRLDGKWNAVAILRDITERKRAETALRRESDFTSAVMNTSGALIVVLDRHGRIVRFNPACEKITGYRQDEARGQTVWDLLLPPEEVDGVKTVFAHLVAGQFPNQHQNYWRARDGRQRLIMWSNTALLDEHGNVEYVIGTGIDVTERKAAEDALRDSEARFRTMIENSSDITTLLDRDGIARYTSPSIGRVLGYGDDELVGQNVFALVHPDDLPQVQQALARVLENPGVAQHVEHRFKDKDGTWRYLESVGKYSPDPSPVSGIVVNSRDISARKQAEEQMRAADESLRKLNRALKTLSACNEALVHAMDEQALLHAICRVIVHTGGYRFAWVGYAEHDEQKTVRPMAFAGEETGFLDTLRFSWADDDSGRSPIGEAIRTGIRQGIRDIGETPAARPPRAEAQRCGFASCAALPLRDGDRVMGVLAIYASEPDAFDEAEIKLLMELTDDLAYGIVALHTRAERERVMEENRRNAARLGKALLETIEAIGSALEKRDPYTAGHQRRVAQLARAIARELNLPNEVIEGIHTGGLIHDVGKIYVPAEILSRPGRLSDAEFNLIKTHTQVGYEIIKGIEFPWPIALMVLQHHERLDGTGYPQGLKGDEICPEAKILAVADVVEAMASHRPYRPGLGIDKALAEIEGLRGVAYDAAAVDACLRLFREKGFVFE